MVLSIVSQDVATRPERAPRYFSLLKLMNQFSSLLFSFRRQDPIHRAANFQACQLGELTSAFCPHAGLSGDLFYRGITFTQVSDLFCVSRHFTFRPALLERYRRVGVPTARPRRDAPSR